MTKTATTAKRKNKTSKAEQIRKLLAQGKLTPKQIAEKVGAPPPYVYQLRTKMRDAAGLAAISDKQVMPVTTSTQGGITQLPKPNSITHIPTLTEEVNRVSLRVNPEQLYTPTKPPEQPRIVLNREAVYGTPQIQVEIERPSFVQRVKDRIRSWLW